MKNPPGPQRRRVLRARLSGGEVRYVAVFKDGEWVGTGDFVMPGRDPMRVIEMRLRRRGDTDWPAGDPVIP